MICMSCAIKDGKRLDATTVRIGVCKKCGCTRVVGNVK